MKELMALTSFRAAGGHGEHLQPGWWKEERTGGRLGGWSKELVLPSSSAWRLPGLSHPPGALGLHPPQPGELNTRTEWRMKKLSLDNSHKKKSIGSYSPLAPEIELIYLGQNYELSSWFLSPFHNFISNSNHPWETVAFSFSNVHPFPSKFTCPVSHSFRVCALLSNYQGNLRPSSNSTFTF